MTNMPLYVYQVIEANDGEGEGEGQVFEVLQDMDEPPLTHHPETGKPVQRLLGTPSTLRKWGPSKVSNQNLERLGFTKYERSGKGTYEKKLGTGPQTLNRG